MKTGKWSVVLSGMVLFASLAACATNPDKVRVAGADTEDVNWSKVMKDSGGIPGMPGMGGMVGGVGGGMGGPVRPMASYQAVSQSCKKDCRTITLKLKIVRDTFRKGDPIHVAHRTVIQDAMVKTNNGVMVPFQSSESITYVNSMTYFLDQSGTPSEAAMPMSMPIGVTAFLTPVINDKTGKIDVDYTVSYSYLDEMISKNYHGVLLQTPLISMPVHITGKVGLPNANVPTRIDAGTSGYLVFLTAQIDKTGKKG